MSCGHLLAWAGVPDRPQSGTYPTCLCSPFQEVCCCCRVSDCCMHLRGLLCALQKADTFWVHYQNKKEWLPLYGSLKKADRKETEQKILVIKRSSYLADRVDTNWYFPNITVKGDCLETKSTVICQESELAQQLLCMVSPPLKTLQIHILLQKHSLFYWKSMSRFYRDLLFYLFSNV